MLIGAFLTLTGENAEFGRAAQNGIDLAVDEIDANVSFPAIPKVLYLDDRGRAQTAQDAVFELIDRDHVVALLGEIASGISTPCGITATRNKVPMLSPCSTAAKVTETGRYVFRACFIDDVQGDFAARYIVKTMGKTRVALATAADEPYSTAIAEAFRKAMANLGVQLACEVSFSQRETDFGPAVRTLKSATPDIIFAPIYFNEMNRFAARAIAEGMPSELFFGSDGWASDEELARRLEGARYIDHWAEGVPYPKSKAFVAAFRAKYGHAPDAVAALSYDAAYLLADAIARATVVTPEAIREALAATHGFEGVSGRLAMDENRNPIKPAVVLAFRGGAPVFEAVVDPS